MTLFEYLSVAVSIVLSLSAAQILSAIRDVLRKDRRYLPHVGWTFLALFTHVVLWWEFWAYREATWTLARFVFVLVNPGLLFIASHALTTPEEGSTGSWEDHYYAIRRSFFIPFAVLLTLSFARDAFVLERSVDWGQHGPELLLIATSIVGAVSDDRRVQFGVVTVGMLVVCLTAALVWVEPGGGSQY